VADFARSTNPEVQAQLDRLSKLSSAGDRLGLERITAVLDRLGRPQDALPPVFHVAGTNGKGSTVAFVRAALEAVLSVALDPAVPAVDRPRHLARDEQAHTVGRWGDALASDARARA